MTASVETETRAESARPAVEQSPATTEHLRVRPEEAPFFRGGDAGAAVAGRRQTVSRISGGRSDSSRTSDVSRTGRGVRAGVAVAAPARRRQVWIPDAAVSPWRTGSTALQSERVGRPALEGDAGRAPRRETVAHRRYDDAGTPREDARSEGVWWLVAVAACTFLVVLVAGFVGISGGSVTPPSSSATTVVQVEPGDTLWGLASRHAPQADTAAVVQRMVDRNGLEGSVVRPGESLIVPFADR